MPWLLWDPGNPVNHLFLAACATGVVSLLSVARGSNMAMFIAALVPVALMTSVRFALGHTLPDYIIAHGGASLCASDVVDRQAAGEPHA